jgi:hypothetical protein
MVIRDLDVMGIAGHPAKHDTPLFIDADAVLSLEVALKSFESVPGRRPQVPEFGCGVEKVELPNGSRADWRRDSPDSLASFAMKKGLCRPTAERNNQSLPFMPKRLPAYTDTMQVPLACFLDGCSTADERSGPRPRSA